MIQTDSTFCTGFRALIEQQMRDLIKKVCKEDWTPKYKVLEDERGVRVEFLDEKSKTWFRKLRGTNATP